MRTSHGYGRLVGFSDGVVAIAITLLVLPLVESASDFHGDVGGFLSAHLTQLLVFLLSFAVIGNFWTVHHQMWEQAVGYNRALLWANLLWLLSIVFLPFPTELLASANNDRATYALYIGTMVVTTVAELILQAILVGNPDLQAEDIRGTLSVRRYLAPVAILLVALVLAVAFPTTIGLWGLALFGLNGVIGRMLAPKTPEEKGIMTKYVLSIDQGTTSTRAMIFDNSGSVVSSGQLEHEQIFPKAGWVEHDPKEIWDNTREVIGQALSKASLTRHDIVAVGITNQRETAVVWDRATGEPVYNAIVWQDTRTQAIVDRIAAGDTDRFKKKVGLPLATYFSGTKIAWILENVDGARERAERGELAFGTTDSWVLWNLTGGVDGGIHATDVTNASRTLFMDLASCSWDEEILAQFGVPVSMLPEIRSSSEVYGTIAASSLLREVPVAGILGDQQAATFGQAAFGKGESKNTYGTGNFLIVNTGEEIVSSKNGLLTTVAYKLGEGPTNYALEGSIAVTGSLIQWLRDNLGLIEKASDVEALAKTVDDNGGVYFVPAFSGLFAPHWQPDARGAILGLTRFANKGHIARAALESVAYQTREVLDAVNADAGVDLAALKVDGGMVANSELMQFQADILDVPVIRPVVAETTALGAAYAAGLAVGFWADLDELRSNWQEGERWEPVMPAEERQRLLRNWAKAVSKTLDWVDDDVR